MTTATTQTAPALQPQAEETPRILGMRDVYFNALFEIFKKDPSCYFVTADNGAPTLDQFFEHVPNQICTVGIAEQQAVGMAAGLALEGRRAFVYAIAPFVTARVWEQLKIDVCAHNVDVTVLGVGAGYAYDIMGPTHHTVDDISLMRTLPNMTVWSPSEPRQALALAAIASSTPGPKYIRFDRTELMDIEGNNAPLGKPVAGVDGEWTAYCDRGYAYDAADIVIVTTGAMTHNALKVAAELSDAHSVLVIDAVKLWPLQPSSLAVGLAGSISNAHIVTYEEHLLAGGLGSSILEVLADEGRQRPVLRLGVDGQFTFTYGGREAIWKKHGLDVETVTARIKEWVT